MISNFAFSFCEAKLGGYVERTACFSAPKEVGASSFSGSAKFAARRFNRQFPITLFFAPNYVRRVSTPKLVSELAGQLTQVYSGE